MTCVFRAAIVVLLILVVVPAASAQWNGTPPNPIWTTSRVGIGTNNPDANFGLDVSGFQNGINVDTSCCSFVVFKKSGQMFGSLSQDGSNSFTLFAATGKALSLGANGTAGNLVIDTTGNVGVGTATPGNSKLSVNASGATGIGFTSWLTRTSGAGSIYAGRIVGVQGSTTAIPRLVGLNTGNGRVDAFATGLVTDNIALEIGSSIDATYGVAATNNYGIYISNMNNVNAQNNYALWYNYATFPFVVTAAGHVGIGTSSPQKQLHVVGDIQVSGNINAKYQDVAEWVPAASDLAPGTVVVLDPTSSNTVRASDHEYDESVAGVVSAQPGLILGEKGDSKEMIATSGRVRVRVDARRSPIRIGDLLVTSDKAGSAMRSQPIMVTGVRIHRPGTVIGKALEPLDHGEGEILVLLSLQ